MNKFKSNTNEYVESSSYANMDGTLSPFWETRKLFMNGLDCKFPLSYNDWISIDDALKAAALYVQYFPQITFAWYKVKSFYADEVLGVETMLQYLEKNVPIIVADPKRFTAKYIYRVAYNCLYCICHDIKRDRERWELEIRNEQILPNGDSVDLFDLAVSYDCDNISSIESELLVEEFWNKIYRLGDDVVMLTDHLLNGGRLAGHIRNRKTELIQQLKDELSVYIDVYL